MTVVKDINEPRVASFKAKLNAKKAAIPVWGLADLGLDAQDVGLSGSFTQVVKVFPALPGHPGNLEPRPPGPGGPPVAAAKGAQPRAGIGG